MIVDIKREVGVSYRYFLELSIVRIGIWDKCVLKDKYGVI